MYQIHRQKSVPYSSDQMYALVNDVKSYPDFVPYCTQSAIISETNHEMVASLTFSVATLNKTITTKNELTPGQQIKVALINGPFKHLQGTWVFEAVDHHRCTVHLDFEFEFALSLINKVFEPIFEKIINDMIQTFECRAKRIYR